MTKHKQHVDAQPLYATPPSDLDAVRALVGKWRDEATARFRDMETRIPHCLNKCADELSALLPPERNG